MHAILSIDRKPKFKLTHCGNGTVVAVFCRVLACRWHGQPPVSTVIQGLLAIYGRLHGLVMGSLSAVSEAPTSEGRARVIPA